MERRDFLKASGLFLAVGAILPGIAKSMLLNKDIENFSVMLAVYQGRKEFNEK
jgi:hypothetical protein